MPRRGTSRLDQEARAHLRGEKDCREGKPIDANPYDAAHTRMAWETGWKAQARRLAQ